MIALKADLAKLIDHLIDFIKFAKDEANSALETGLTEYVGSQIDKHYLVNTFLYRYEKIKFNDAYYPIKCQYKEFVTDFTKMDNIFRNYNFISVIGTAGSGKSMLSKHVFLNALKEGFKIPFLVEFRNLDLSKGNLSDFIISLLVDYGVEPNKQIAKRALASGKFLFIFDGYDEIPSALKEPIDRNFNQFVDRFSSNSFIIFSRPFSNAEHLPRFEAFSVLDLSQEDVIKFIKANVQNIERETRMLDLLDTSKLDDYGEYLKSPLLLSMFILNFETHPEIPSKKSVFYEYVFDTLYSKHDGITKGSYFRERKSGLERNQFLQVLNAFSYLTLTKDVFSYTENVLRDNLETVRSKLRGVDFDTDLLIIDLCKSLSIFIMDGLEYKFPHRSLQEYFAASFIKSIDQGFKEKAYGQYHSAIRKDKVRINHNFLSICREIDHQYYLKYFFLPVCNSMYRKKIADKSLAEISAELSRYMKLMAHVTKVHISKSAILGDMYYSISYGDVNDEADEYNVVDFFILELETLLVGVMEEIAKACKQKGEYLINLIDKELVRRKMTGDREVNLYPIVGMVLDGEDLPKVKEIKEVLEEKIANANRIIEIDRSNSLDLIGM